jgi:hypothetical protein
LTHAIALGSVITLDTVYPQVSELSVPERLATSEANAPAQKWTDLISASLSWLPAIAQTEATDPELLSPYPAHLPPTQSLSTWLAQLESQLSSPETSPNPSSPETSPNPESPLPTETVPDELNRIELRSDKQEYDQTRQVATASGNVVMKFRGAVLQADQLQVDLATKRAIASGTVTLARGEQILQGDEFVYNFVDETGSIVNARGEVFLPSASTDFDQAPPPGPQPLENSGDRFLLSQPPQNVTSAGGLTVSAGVSERARLAEQAGLGPDLKQGGAVNRLRFSAERVEFTAEGWEATAVEITNDPFTPAELKLKARSAQLVTLASGRRAIRASRPRLVFDNSFSLPLLQPQVVIDQQQRDVGLPRIGFDGDERGGLYLDRQFDIISTDRLRWSLTPEFYLQRVIEDNDGNPISADNYGLSSRLQLTLTPTTILQGSASITSLDLSRFDEETRASLRLNQKVGINTLSLGAVYRDRIFNGSLGFQTVQSSVGLSFSSPSIALGNSGLNLRYQLGIDRIRATTDREDLLGDGRDRGLVTLTRTQANVALDRSFLLWKGQPLPATATEGLRYTPIPIVPFLRLNTGVEGGLSVYTSDDTQGLVTGRVELQAQLGHFSKPFLDYTGLRLGYSQALIGDRSPFLFDRAEDTRKLFGGITQQIYGPFRFSFQFSMNLNTGEAISNSYSLEYSRRTFNVSINYDPILEIGGISLRINSFNWTRGGGPTNITPVEDGILRLE